MWLGNFVASVFPSSSDIVEIISGSPAYMEYTIMLLQYLYILITKYMLLFQIPAGHKQRRRR